MMLKDFQNTFDLLYHVLYDGHTPKPVVIESTPVTEVWPSKEEKKTSKDQQIELNVLAMLGIDVNNKGGREDLLSDRKKSTYFKWLKQDLFFISLPTETLNKIKS